MTKKLRDTLLPAVLFFTVTMPFRSLFSVLGLTEMRPASALPPVLGLMAGIPGALGCAIGNFIADMVSGYDLLICILGFPAQLIYGILPLLIWKLIRWRSADEPAVFRLNNAKNVIRYILIIFVNSVIMAVLLGAIMQGFAISPLLSTATLMMFLNNFVFCMVLGIPAVIFLSIKKSKAGNGNYKGLSLNERLVLVFLLAGVISAGMIGVFAYTELHGIIADPLAMWNRIYFYMAANLFIFDLIAIAVLRYAEKRVTIPIESIADMVEHYVSGGGGTAVGKKDGALIAAACEKFGEIRNETGVLAGAFRTMVLDLESYIDHLTAVTAEKERIGAELSVAAKIQASMLPCVFPPFPAREEFDIYASMLPAKEVGGDFYDFFFIDENILAIVIADVSDKGVPAALFMVIAKTLIKNNACAGLSPEAVFETVNNMLCENNEEGMFVTAILGYMDIRAGRFAFVNAGHNPPLLKRADGQFDWLKGKADFVLAGLENMTYRRHDMALRPGDTLLLYTDGIIEAVNPASELFGETRLLEAMNRNPDLPLHEITVFIKREIDKFAQGTQQADDMTMLAVRINKRKELGVI
ncbi:MAG: SpoIIE family protein phosphatase [Oscillospiraceae bacterium]|nr:SpoIIE family protein phosphatase [Oscillospiraceae bacterium]